jgi:hypothetical protein
MIFTKVYCNMDNYKLDNINAEYDFTFKIHMQVKIITIVTIQIVHLTMLSFQGNELQYHFLKYTHFFIEFTLGSC